MLLRLLILGLTSMFIFNNSSAQTKIRGIVTDTLNNPLGNVTISIKHDNSILKFAKTDDSGIYTFVIEQNETFTIEAKLFGYKTISQPYKTNQSVYNFKLRETTINLDAVNVKHKPIINIKGDTLNYRTADFASQNDRSIGDVLKNMPGINVAENGKITYNNIPISQLYIDGDNVLDDKYNIGTKSIPHKSVTRIQVIDHDQPIKMLQKNNLSNDVAINLVIDKTSKTKVIGNAELAAGFPKRYDENVDMMLFKQQFKFINNISLNNIGTDLSEDVIAHNSSLNINSAENNRPNFQLSTGMGYPPYLPKSRYLFNNSAIANINNLIKFNGEKQLKTNIYYRYDKQVQNTIYTSQITLPADTINFGELQNNKSRNQSFFSQLNYIDNANTHYINNSLNIEYSPNNSNSLISDLLNPFQQRLNQNRFNLINNLKYLQTLKSGVILNINSYLEKNSQTEQLDLSPGINEAILNSGISYRKLIQQTNIPAFFTNNHLTYSTVKNRLTQSYQVGFTYQNIDFTSSLAKIQLNDVRAILHNGLNKIDWNRFQLYVNPGLDYKSDAVQFILRLPFSLNMIDYDSSKSYKRLLKNPYIGLNYLINQENKLTFGYSFNEGLGKIEDIYTGIILRSYRSILANHIPLPYAKSQRISAGYRYQKAVSMIFASIQTYYASTTLDNITESTISNSIQTRHIIPFANHLTNLTVNGSIGKYLMELNTNIGLDVGFSSNKGKQLQNDVLFQLVNRSSTIGINSNIKISKSINWSFRSNYTVTTNLINGIENIQLQQLKQFSNIDVSILKRIALSLSANHIFIHQAEQKNLNYLFTDINLKYKWLKIKTDFEFGLNNIANIKNFNTYFIDANTLTSSNYKIPGRYTMLSAIFAFN